MEKSESKEKTKTWDYRMHLFGDATMPKTIIKIFFFVVLSILFFVVLLEIIDGNISLDVFLELATVFGLIYLGLIVLTLVSYYIVFAMIHGGKYDIIYQMDDKGVSFITAKGSMNKAKKAAVFGALVGIAAGSLTAVGSNMIAGSRSSMYTKFASVTRVVVHKKKKKMILTESHVAKNHIYANEDDFEEIERYIVDRCKKAKVIVKGQNCDRQKAN